MYRQASNSCRGFGSMERDLVGIGDHQILEAERHRSNYYIVWAAAILKAGVRCSTAAAVRDEGVVIVAVACKDKRFKVREPVPLDAHGQDYGFHGWIL